MQHLDGGGGWRQGGWGRGGVMVGVAPPIREDVWDTRQPPQELLDNLAEQLRLSDFSADASRPS